MVDPGLMVDPVYWGGLEPRPARQNMAKFGDVRGPSVLMVRRSLRPRTKGTVAARVARVVRTSRPDVT